MKSIAVTLLLVLAAVPAFAPSSVYSSGGGTFSTSALATPSGRGPTTAELVTRINAMSMRPVPSTPPQPVVRSGMLWVPDRYVAVHGAPQGVLVPGHWERLLSNGQVYVPPLAISHPQGASGMIPAGERPPVDQRIGP